MKKNILVIIITAVLVLVGPGIVIKKQSEALSSMNALLKQKDLERDQLVGTIKVLMSKVLAIKDEKTDKNDQQATRLITEVSPGISVISDSKSPNPNQIEIALSKRVSSGPHTYLSPDWVTASWATDDAETRLAGQLFKIEGVVSIGIDQYSIVLEKSDLADTAKVTKGVVAVLAKR
jgi:hypothetical protein